MSGPINDAKSGQTKDAQDPAGTCPLKKSKLQLIPVRYGLVETLSVKEHTNVPFETHSKPLGIRFMRDGWIYVLVEDKSKWILHEYRVEQGQITKLLWKDAEVVSDERTASIGEASLVFDRCSVIYCSYSELQWTAKKCSQVIGSNEDRLRFMQKINLSSFDAIKGGTDLLTPKQASELIAECAEEIVAPSNDFGYQPYEWEHKLIFSSTEFANIHNGVLTEYQNDHLYLILNDDIGVLRDLASYQGLVAKSLEEWQSDERQYQKYVEGSYIENQIRISPEKLDALAAMLGNDRFTTELTERQKQSVVAWIKEYDDKYDDLSRPTVGEKYRLMEEELGSNMMNEYKDLIHDIQDQFASEIRGVPAWKIWDDSNGKQEIKDLINQEEMEIFIINERKKLSYWEERINTISLDRINLFSRFYFAAWYFDSSSDIQLEEYLAAEYGCIQDICWNDSASKLVESKLEEIPWVVIYRALSTLPTAEYDKLTEAISKKISEAKLIATHNKDLTELNSIGKELRSIINNFFKPNKNINSNDSLNSYSQLIDSTFTPASTIGLTEKVEEFFNKMSNFQEFSPSDVLRSYSGAAWLSVLQAYRNDEIFLGFASEQELHKFNSVTELAITIRGENTSLKNSIRQVWAEHRKKGRSGQPDVEKLKEKHKANQAKLSELEVRIHDAISPFSEAKEKAGFYIKGLTESQRLNVRDIASDYRAVKNLRSWSALSGWDGLSGIIAILAVYNAVKTYQKYQLSTDKKVLLVLSDFASALGATFGLAQGLRASYDMLAYKQVSHSISKLNYGSILGQWTTILGTFAYGFSVGSSALKAYQSSKLILEAVEKGDTASIAKHSVNALAESTMTVVNGVGFTRSSQVIWNVVHAEKAARAAVWASNSSRLLSIGIRINMIGLVVSAIQLGTTIGYNYFNLSDYMQWFRNSLWGDEPQNYSLKESNEKLAQLTAKPVMSIEKVSLGNVLSLTMPGITINELDDAGIEISVYWLVDQQKNTWQQWTEAAGQQWVCLSAPNEPLEIGIPIYSRESNANHGIGVELHYLPTPDSSEKSIVRYQTMSLNRLGRVSEVSMLKVKTTTKDNLLPLTTNQLKLQVV